MRISLEFRFCHVYSGITFTYIHRNGWGIDIKDEFRMNMDVEIVRHGKLCIGCSEGKLYN